MGAVLPAVPSKRENQTRITANLETSKLQMTKATETALALFAASAVYFAMATGTIPTGEFFQTEILPFLPWWALVTFGSYALGTLGWGVLTFKDKEGSYRELLQQIDEAKTFYKEKGLDLDA